MKQISKEEMFSQLVDSINQWLTDCLYLCGGNLRGKIQIQGVRDEIWKQIVAYSETIKSAYAMERNSESEKTANEITGILNDSIEEILRKNNSNNYFVIDLSVHKKEIVEKLNQIR